MAAARFLFGVDRGAVAADDDPIPVLEFAAFAGEEINRTRREGVEHLAQ
ncbi:hypothetical protein [Lentzea indica]|nr:hypothetical protein [Lentzea indica]